MSAPIRVVVAEDEAIIRLDLVETLTAEGYEVVGDTGRGDGPVSLAGAKQGPFAGVYPLVGLVSGRSDGYIYNVIRIGSGGFPGLRMPEYSRIPEQDRWDIVNYVRFLDAKGGNL